MTSLTRNRKAGIVDYDTQIKEVRWQLADQLKVLDQQLEQKTQQLQDLTDYLRRRGEIEGEYARSLDKLSERFTTKIKRKEPSGPPVPSCWLALLTQTRQDAKEHASLSDSCSTLLTQPLTHYLDYTQRLAKRSKDVCAQLQDGLLKVTAELQTTWRAYYQYHTEYVSAEGKLKEAEKQEEKQKQSANKKVERLIEKRQGKVQDIHLKCTKARNDYLLNLSAANASMNKYYLHDVSTIIDCADGGYHMTLSRVLQAYVSTRERAQQSLRGGLQQLHTAMTELNQNQDRDALLQTHHSTFCLPFRFQYQPHDGDQVSEVSAECEVRDDLKTRCAQLESRLVTLTTETEEAGKTVLSAHSVLLESICDDDLQTSSSCGTGGGQQTQEGSSENLATKAKRKANLQDTEVYYFNKVKEYLFGSSLIAKLQAKHDLLKVAIEKAEATNGHKPRGNAKKSVCVRRTAPKAKCTQKLFNGDMLAFIQESGQEIPFVVESCIRFINLNGLHHEGIFRVPGSQTQVNNLRDAFERGDDLPLDDSSCDLDSVAGVLKLYFRSLEKPLFPEDSLALLLECTLTEDEAERAAKLAAIVSSYPPPAVVVMRYLFAFLHHVSQYSDENMMLPHNLAVCFGPSLVRPAGNLVALQPQINALIKNIIVQHEAIFPGPAELLGPLYESCMTLEEDTAACAALDDCDVIVEEGDGELDLNAGVSAGSPPKRERHRSNSRDAADLLHSRPRPVGGSAAPSGKFTLQLPMGPPVKSARPLSPGFLPLSPGFLRRECPDVLAEEITLQVDKEVCHQMNTVFKELLSRQGLHDPPSSASQPPQKKGAGRRGKP